MLEVQVGMVNSLEGVGKGQGRRKMLEVKVGIVNS